MPQNREVYNIKYVCHDQSSINKFKTCSKFFYINGFIHWSQMTQRITECWQIWPLSEVYCINLYSLYLKYYMWSKLCTTATCDDWWVYQHSDPAFQQLPDLLPVIVILNILSINTDNSVMKCLHQGKLFTLFMAID